MNRTIPYHAGLFRNAMIGWVGRKPDIETNLGHDGFYHYVYEPNDADEIDQLQQGALTLQEFLRVFEFDRLRSRCEYGRLPNPQDGQENKDYLDIMIYLRENPPATTYPKRERC